jgi:ABC-type branched-subunit amino acid transport system permease subunit
MVLVGGAAQIWGVHVGSVVVSGLPELLRFTREYYMLIYGLGLVLVVMFFPLGLSGHLRLRRSGTGGTVSRNARKFGESVDAREQGADIEV